MLQVIIHYYCIHFKTLLSLVQIIVKACIYTCELGYLLIHCFFIGTIDTRCLSWPEAGEIMQQMTHRTDASDN